jgi:hypothetical protein
MCTRQVEISFTALLCTVSHISDCTLTATRYKFYFTHYTVFNQDNALRNYASLHLTISGTENGLSTDVAECARLRDSNPGTARLK